MIYPLGMGLVKISCLSLYLRLFSSERFRIVIYCSMAFVVAMTIATIFSAVFECIPIESNWVLSEWATRKCINRADQQYATSALAFTTDIAVLFLPMKYLLRMFLISWPSRRTNNDRTPYFHTRKDTSHRIDVIGQLVSNPYHTLLTSGQR